MIIVNLLRFNIDGIAYDIMKYQCRVYLHGKAGDIAAIELSEQALIASDIIDCLSNAFKAIE